MDIEKLKELKPDTDFDLDEVKLDEIKLDYIKLTEYFCKWFNVFVKDFKDIDEGKKVIENYKGHFALLIGYFYSYNKQDIDSFRFKLKIEDYIEENYMDICEFVDGFYEVYE